jgi:putative protein kinase ArgK-like GTPase of G3E family
MLVRHLDQVCVVLLAKVIAVNKDDNNDLILALKDLKNAYASLIRLCHHKLTAMTC